MVYTVLSNCMVIQVSYGCMVLWFFGYQRFLKVITQTLVTMVTKVSKVSWLLEGY